MIRDLIVIKNGGVRLFHKNFGECHSFGINPDILSGLITSIQMMSEKLSGESIHMIKMSDRNLAFHKSDINTYTIVCDLEDNFVEINAKIKRISDIFESNYERYLVKFNGDVSVFENFGETLIGMNIAQRNCGGRPECDRCENSKKALPVEKITKTIKGRVKKFKFGIWKSKEKYVESKIREYNYFN